MDLKPTKEKVIYSLIITILISIILSAIYGIIYKEMSFEHFSPEKFNIAYLVPILIFIATYLFLGWYMTHDVRIL